MSFVLTANDGEQTCTAPCVYTPHLVSCVETVLEELSRYALGVSVKSSHACVFAMSYRNFTMKTEDISCCLFMCRAQALTWYDSHIPTDEIWVKLGGDKGGGSFKMSFQVTAPCTSVYSKMMEFTIEVFVRLVLEVKKLIAVNF